MFNLKTLVAFWWANFCLAFWAAILWPDRIPWWPTVFFFFIAAVTSVIAAGSAAEINAARQQALKDLTEALNDLKEVS